MTNTDAPPSAPTSAQSRRADAGLVRTLGLFTTITIVVGAVIGSGIFKKPGIMAAQVGSAEVLFCVWLLAGIITLFGAMTNAEIASQITDTGGQYVYFDRIFGPFSAFLLGWSGFAVIQTGSIAALSNICGEAFGRIVPLPEMHGKLATFAFHLPFIGDIVPFKEIGIKLFGTTLIVALTAVNYLGVRFGGIVQNISSVAKVGAMLALAGAALLVPGVGTTRNFTQASAVAHPHVQAILTAITAALQGKRDVAAWAETAALLAAIAAALKGAFWAFHGWDKVTFVAGEVKKPQRNIPIGLVVGMLIVTALYLLMNAAYAYVMPIDQMAASKLVAADVADKISPGGGRWISVAIMISTFGACNACILGSARLYFSMARRNVFPQFLGVAHPRFHTPAASLIVQCLWSIALLFSGTFDTLTDTLVFVSWIFYAAGAYGVFVLRRREPNAPRPYKVPGYPVVPLLFILFAGVYIVMTIYDDIVAYKAAIAAGQPAMMNSAFGAALMLLGTPVYFYYRMKSRAARNSSEPDKDNRQR